MVKKLAGAAAGTAAWATNVGNEFGQVLISVLTAAEGAGLNKMAEGLTERYSQANQEPPVLLYVDRDCCSDSGSSKAKSLFGRWPDLQVRLDVWHFMRRLASACTTENHQLYGTFMAKLSACIFEWDAGDYTQLHAAKSAELQQQGITGISCEDVSRRLTRQELQRHCRRRTRGSEATTKLLQQVIEVLDGEEGCDTMGVPLLDHEKIQEAWRVQQKHIPCLQDPEGIQLYTQTGTLQKGGMQLPVFRCARGSTSLESFHLHLQRFVPGQ